MEDINIITKAGVYKLLNKINNKIYIGKALNLKNRMMVHRNSINLKCDYNSLIMRAVKKHGWENFEIEILHHYDNEINNIELLALECAFIEFYDSTNKEIGYNILICGTDWTGFHHSEKTKKKLSNVHKLSNRFKGEKNPFYGKKHSKDIIDKIKSSAGYKNRDFSKNKKQVKQIDIKTGKVIKIWPSGREAAIGLGKNKNFGHITTICKDKLLNRKILCTQTLGFKWEYV